MKEKEFYSQKGTYNRVPLSKKIIWGESGIARKLNLAPKNRTGELKLRHKMLQLHQNGGVELYHDGGKKFETQTNGITVIGGV